VNALRAAFSRGYYALQARRGAAPTGAQLAEREAMFTRRAALQRHQDERLVALLEHAGRTVPHYRDVFRARGLTPGRLTADSLGEVPVLTKSDIRAAGPRMLSEAVPATDRRPNASGGSTGEPLHLYQDSGYVKAGQLAAPLFDMWTGWRRGEPVALLWGAPTDIARYGLVRERVRHLLQNRFLVDAFDLDEGKLARAAALILARRPALVVAYASAAYLLAHYLTERGIRIEAPPRGVITSAEVLLPHYRRTIEAAFRCRAFNRYGSREVGFVAMECAHGRLHLNTPDVVVEVHDPGPDGVGDLLITQLNNRVFPLIRYRIGDIGAVRDLACACKRELPCLTELRGRRTDFIRTPDGRLIHGEWFTHLFYEVNGVVLFTFRQVGARQYVFEVLDDASLDRAAFDRAIEKARRRLGPSATVAVHFVSRFDVTPSGKHRFVVNEVPDLNPGRLA
jgi:phenylacetate-CoA ligase